MWDKKRYMGQPKLLYHTCAVGEGLGRGMVVHTSALTTEPPPPPSRCTAGGGGNEV